MLLVIEIMLTVAAWKKGWRGWVVLPWAIVIAVAAVITSAAMTEGEAFGAGFVCDLVLIAVLGIMAATARGSQTEPGSAESKSHSPQLS